MSHIASKFLTVVVFEISRVGNNISQKFLFYLHVVAAPVSVFAPSTEDIHPSVWLSESGLNSD
jgi:hypothetical protein